MVFDKVLREFLAGHIDAAVAGATASTDAAGPVDLLASTGLTDPLASTDLPGRGNATGAASTKTSSSTALVSAPVTAASTDLPASSAAIVLPPADFRYGYENLGPLLYGFSRWLHGRLAATGAPRLYFLARDGELLRRAYALIYGASQAGRLLAASRRSFVVPTLAYEDSVEAMLELVFEIRLPFRGILQKLGLTATELDQLPQTPLATRFLSSQALLASSEHRAILRAHFQKTKDRAASELVLLRDYLRQEGLARGAAAFVDIGWRGRTQEAVAKIARREGWPISLDGYYVGVQPFSEVAGTSGFLFDPRHDGDFYLSRLRGALKAFEALFVSHEGSVTGFVRTADGIAAERAAWTAADERRYARYYAIQAGALAFARDLTADTATAQALDKRPPAFWFDGLSRTLITATPPAVARQLGDLPFDQGGGDLIRLAAPRSLAFYALHPRQLRADIGKVVWLSGFMTRLLKLKLPYYLLLKILP